MICAMGAPAIFVDCIRETRALSPKTQIEVLVPDFRGRDDRALEILKGCAARCDEPQFRNRATLVQRSAARF